MDRVVEFGGSKFQWSWWSGQRLSGSADAPIAIDTETELIRDPLHRPRIAIAMAFDGKRLVAIHPSKVGEFLWQHRREHFVGHNYAFDHFVLHDLLKDQPGRRRLLWDACDAGRIHDSMLLDALTQLATGKYHRTIGGGSEDSRVIYRNLAAACEAVGLPLVDKESPFRTRFAEFLDQSQEQIEQHPEFLGFMEYALGDVIAGYELYKRQRPIAIAEMRKVGWTGKKQERYEITHDALEKWGPLTEVIQVQASIVLYELSRTPLRVDREKRTRLEAECREKYQEAFATLEASAPGLFKKYKAKRFDGRYRMTQRSLVPQLDQAVLKYALAREAAAIGIEPLQSDGKLKGASTSAKAWVKYAPQSPFIAAWVNLERYAKQLEFVRGLDAEAVYSRYNLMMKTGRTSAGAWREKNKLTLPSLNIQQLPRGAEVRSLIVAPEGKLLAAIDYSYIELRTLAATAFAKFGWSKLREAIIDHTLRGGLDPHQRTAATLLGVSESEYLRLPKEQQKTSRQSSKALNFGFPGGLGVEKFVAYAAASYGVVMTKSEAKAAKAAWMRTYPEMAEYLADATVDGIRYQIGESAAKVFARASWVSRKAATDWLRGADQTETLAERGRDLIESVCRVAKRLDLVTAIQADERPPELRQIVQYRACSLTGRVRANTDFTATCNTRFQSLAADGGKRALWKLTYAGLKVVGFIHDELLLEVDERTAQSDLRKAKQIMIDAMAEVLDGVPVAVEGEVSKSWQKA